MKMQNIKLIVSVAAMIAVLVMLVGCGGSSSNLPSFLNSDRLTRIEVVNNQTGQKGQASKDLDNVNELLNMLHLDNLSPDTHKKASEPTSSTYTITGYSQGHVVWTIQVMDTPTSSRVYIHDGIHAANSGLYQLQQPIASEDLTQFIRKYPAS